MPERPKLKGKRKSNARLIGRVFLVIVLTAIVLGGVYLLRQEGIPLDKEETSSMQTEASRLVVGIFCARACVTVDDEGKAIDFAPRPQGSLILYIDNEFIESPSRGEKVLTENILKELTFLKDEIYNETGVHLLKASQSRLVAEDFDVLTNQGWRIRLSTANNAYATVRILSETLDQVQQKNQNIEYVDLRIENRVYLKTL